MFYHHLVINGVIKMITKTDGYLSLIEYLSNNISLFEKHSSGCSNSPTIKQFIRYQMVEQLVLLFNEHSELTQDKKLIIVNEVNRVTDDLFELLAGNIEHKIDQNQRHFFIDFAGLLKNLFDAHLFELTLD